MIIAVQLETWSGSPVVRTVGRSYQRRPAAAFADAPAGLTYRQAVFYRNLIRIAEAVGSAEIPVDFKLPTGERLHLDRGCMKIAELAGFIEPLRDDLGRCGLVNQALVDLLTGRPRLCEFGDESSIENGHSVVLRVVCGNVTALLGGNFNVPAESLLLVAHTGVGA